MSIRPQPGLERGSGSAHRILSLCIGFCLIGIPMNTPSAESPSSCQTVAFVDFEGAGIDTPTKKAMTNRAQTEFQRISKCTVLERGRISEILKEQGFQQTGCTSTECAVEMGKVLGVQCIITGNIDKVGSLTSVTMRTIDVSSGKIAQNVTDDCNGCNLESVFTGSMIRATRALAGFDLKTPEEYNKRGKALFEQGKYSDAIALFHKAVLLSPDNTLALAFIGASYSNVDQRDSTITYLNRSLAIDPGYGFALGWRGYIYKYWSTNIDMAISDYSGAIKSYPNNAGYYLERADLHLENKDYDRAQEDIESAVKLGKRSKTLVQAQVYMCKGLWKEAIDLLSADTAASSQRTLATIYLENNQHYKARKIIDHLAKLGSNATAPRLGIQIMDLGKLLFETRKGLPSEGVFIQSVMCCSPAVKAGILSNDVVLSFDGRKTFSADSLRSFVASSTNGKKVPLTLWRKGKTVSLEVVPSFP